MVVFSSPCDVTPLLPSSFLSFTLHPSTLVSTALVFLLPVPPVLAGRGWSDRNDLSGSLQVTPPFHTPHNCTRGGRPVPCHI